MGSDVVESMQAMVRAYMFTRRLDFDRALAIARQDPPRATQALLQAIGELKDNCHVVLESGVGLGAGLMFALRGSDALSLLMAVMTPDFVELVLEDQFRRNPDQFSKSDIEMIRKRFKGDKLVNLIDTIQGERLVREADRLLETRREPSEDIGRVQEETMAGPSISAAEGARRIRDQVAKAEDMLCHKPVSKADFLAWSAGTDRILGQAFGTGSRSVRAVMTVGAEAMWMSAPESHALAKHHAETLESRIKIMNELANSLEQDNAVVAGKEGDPNVYAVITWSGRSSHAIASFLYEWLPKVVAGIKPWISSEDIAKGTKWFPELMKQLGKTFVSVICVTPENYRSPWVYYEAGVIAAKQDASRVCSILFGVDSSLVKESPFGEFQWTVADKEDIWRLMKSINAALGDGANDEKAMRVAYESKWPDLEMQIKVFADRPAPKGEPAETVSLLSEYKLSEEAKELLREACKDRDGRILFMQHDAGLEIQINGCTFVNEGSGREQASWKAGFNELLTAGLIESYRHQDEVFQLTREGYKVADML